MDKQSLAQLIEISRAVGARPDYVQVGGGNTSVKSPDGRTMAIKASGTALTAMSESAGWVEVDIAAVLSIFERKDLATLETDAREARVLQHFSSAVVGGSGAAFGRNRAPRHARQGSSFTPILWPPMP